jgi:hypothetical protein
MGGLQFCNLGVLQFCNLGVLQFGRWCFAVLQFGWFRVRDFFKSPPRAELFVALGRWGVTGGGVRSAPPPSSAELRRLPASPPHPVKEGRHHRPRLAPPACYTGAPLPR